MKIINSGNGVESFRENARKLGSKKSRPTWDEVADYSKAADSLPVPDFGEQFEREKLKNTKAFREIVAQVWKILGISSD
ncbi:MAG: hypothetical protein ACT4QE_11115 [Anaerolineales bacterium]